MYAHQEKVFKEAARLLLGFTPASSVPNIDSVIDLLWKKFKEAERHYLLQDRQK